MSSKRLSLAEKIKILDIYDEEKLSCRTLTEKIKGKFGVGKTQFAEMIKNAETIRELWTTNGNEERKRMKIRKTSALSNNDLIEKLPEYMKCNDSDYESIDSELCTEESNDDILEFVPQDSGDEGMSDDDAAVENSDSTITPTAPNLSTAIEYVQNLILLATQTGDTNRLQCLTQL